MLQNNILILFFIIFAILIYTIMAVATSMAIIGGLGLAKGVFDTIKAGKEKKQRQAELDDYQRQTLSNVYRNMQIPTIGTDIMRDKSSRNMATAMNTIGNAGTRAIIGATPKLVAGQNDVARSIQKEIDDKIEKRGYAIAGDDAQIRGMQEQRENADLAGLGNAVDTARQDMNMGMNTALNGLMTVGAGIYDKDTEGKPSGADFMKHKVEPMSFAPKSIWG